MTMVDNLEFPWQPGDPIPWEVPGFEFISDTADWFINAEVSHYNLGEDVPKEWRAYASVHIYKKGTSHRYQRWHATAAEGMAAVDAHISEHAS
jgi:hypothetical protein